MKKIQTISLLFLLAAIPAMGMKKHGTSVTELKDEGHCDLTIAMLLAYNSGAIDSTQEQDNYYDDLTNPIPDLKAICRFVKNFPAAIWKFTETSWLPVEDLPYDENTLEETKKQK